jgi:hypothetical protein
VEQEQYSRSRDTAPHLSTRELEGHEATTAATADVLLLHLFALQRRAVSGAKEGTTAAAARSLRHGRRFVRCTHSRDDTR